MLDGGIVSNTPAWVFDAERANVGPQTPTVIFRLVDEAIGNDQAYERWSFPTFVASFVRTAAFGAGHLETRAIESAYAIALRSSVAPTDFLAAGNAARRVVEDGEQSVRRFFLTRIGPREPERMRALLRHVAFYVRDQASATLTRRPDRVRCGVIVPSSVDPERVQVRYSAFMEDAADDHLVMSRRSLGVASVFLRKEPVITRPDLLRAEAQAGREDKYEHLLRPLDIRTTYTVPIFAKAEAWMCAPEDRAELIGALYIDADSDLAPMLGLVEAEDRFATLAQIVGEELQDRVVISGSEDTVGGRGPTDWEAIAMGTVWVSTRKLRTMVSDVGLRALLERIARDLKPSGLSGAPQRFS